MLLLEFLPKRASQACTLKYPPQGRSKVESEVLGNGFKAPMRRCSQRARSPASKNAECRQRMRYLVEQMQEKKPVIWHFAHALHDEGYAWSAKRGPS